MFNFIIIETMKTKEEILYEIIDAKWEYNESDIFKAMEEYAQQNLREELIKYDRAYWGLRGDSEKIVDEYLKKK
jgi:hypothetical protein